MSHPLGAGLAAEQIPEINGHKLAGARLIANPNCTTAIAAMALWPLHREFGLRSIIMSTYQAASGAGADVRVRVRVRVGWCCCRNSGEHGRSASVRVGIGRCRAWRSC